MPNFWNPVSQVADPRKKRQGGEYDLENILGELFGGGEEDRPAPVTDAAPAISNPAHARLFNMAGDGDTATSIQPTAEEMAISPDDVATPTPRTGKTFGDDLEESAPLEAKPLTGSRATMAEIGAAEKAPADVAAARKKSAAGRLGGRLWKSWKAWDPAKTGWAGGFDVLGDGLESVFSPADHAESKKQEKLSKLWNRLGPQLSMEKAAAETDRIHAQTNDVIRRPEKERLAAEAKVEMEITKQINRLQLIAEKDRVSDANFDKLITKNGQFYKQYKDGRQEPLVGPDGQPERDLLETPYEYTTEGGQKVFMKGSQIGNVEAQKAYRAATIALSRENREDNQAHDAAEAEKRRKDAMQKWKLENKVDRAKFKADLAEKVKTRKMTSEAAATALAEFDGN